MATMHAGWYPDPWNIGPFRWWDGHAWTAHVGGVAEKKPRLPMWLSVPVVLCGLPMILISLALAYSAPAAIPLGFVPLLIVGPVLWWLDRVEPEPLSSRVHAVLWGGTVAAFLSSIVNTLVAIGSSEVIAAVVSAPLIEEATKALGIYWALRRKELDGVMDGVVYAGWTALGFAIVEDFLYFATAAEQDQLLAVFILRALLTPFAHPLFTAWTGIAIGLAVSKRKPVLPYALVGYALAVGCHAAWNGSLALSDSMGDGAIAAIAALLFVVLFLAVGIALISFRRKEQARFTEMVPFLASRYGLTPGEVQVFSAWRPMLKIRRGLPKSQRRHFDGVHAALARLALLHHNPPIDPVSEELLAAQLLEARSAPST